MIFLARATSRMRCSRDKAILNLPAPSLSLERVLPFEGTRANEVEKYYTIIHRCLLKLILIYVYSMAYVPLL